MARRIERFAVIYGNDHCSLPDAVHRAQELAVSHVVHADQRCTLERLPDGQRSLNAWRVFELERHIEELLSLAGRVHLDSLPWGLGHKPVVLGSFCFISPHIRLHDSDFADAGTLIKDMDQLIADVMATSSKKTKAIIVPSMNPFAVSIAESGGALTLHRVQNGPQLLETPAVGQTGLLLLSPGFCRAHTFCTYDSQEDRIRWHSC